MDEKYKKQYPSNEDQDNEMTTAVICSKFQIGNK